ncbi:hypothetical protein [Arcobacter sp.]|uniref:hypothetical protein n=1 Tax=Arcobacter sp. TaxID=1872629 RepID=UPI003D0DBBAC
MDTLYFFSTTVILLLIFFEYVRREQLKKENFIDNYELPKQIFTNLKKHYPNLKDKDFDLIDKAYKMYLKLFIQFGRYLIPIPSVILDRVQIEFMHCKEYNNFSKQAFGFYLTKSKFTKMKSKNEPNIDTSTVWTLSCDYENIDAKNPEKLPKIFEIDKLINIDDGIKYTINCDDENLYCVKKLEKILFLHRGG